MVDKNEVICDVKDIIEMIPHRYPILLIDRVIEFNKGVGLVALKNVTFNEPHFMGHFPNHPVMPGVLIVEAIAQAAAIYVVKTLGEEAKGKIVYFMSIDDVKFRKPVVPGDSLHIHVEAIQNRGKVWKFKGEVKVDGKKVTEGVVKAMIADE